jgi:hypothetical protein
MGHVGVNAGIYLLSKLQMSLYTEFDTSSLFDVEGVDVKGGLIHAARRPRSRLFLWSDPDAPFDLLVFLGEGQPATGKYAFCRELIRYVHELGVERVYTFAAMATQMRPEDPSRVFAAATDAERLSELRQLELEIVEDGQIGGLNGILLGAAAEGGLSGACLLGEMPHMFTQLPFPRASHAILEVFTNMCGIELDLTELAEQAAEVDRQLGELLARIEAQLPDRSGDEEPEFSAEPTPDEPDPAVTRRIEQLFQQASKDRSKAFELKQELDKSGRFKEYEDRFLDLFRKADGDAK